MDGAGYFGIHHVKTVNLQIMSLGASPSWLVFILLSLNNLVVAQECIQWRPFSQATEESRLLRKKLMVEVSIRSCAWCKVMDKTTLSDPEVVQFINDHYVASRLNAEETEPLEFKGRTYRFRESGARAHHELAVEFMRGRLSFPTIVFLDENQNVIQPIPGYQDPAAFLMVLKYFGENHYQRIPWEKYSQQLGPNGSLTKPVRQGVR